MGKPKLSKNARKRAREQNISCLTHFWSFCRWLSATGSCKCTARLQECDENVLALKALRERIPQQKRIINTCVSILALLSLLWPQNSGTATCASVSVNVHWARTWPGGVRSGRVVRSAEHSLELLTDSLKIVMLVSSQIVRTYREECYGTQFSPEISR